MGFLGQDNEEGRAEAGVHIVQVQNAANTETLQTVRLGPFSILPDQDD